MKNILILSPDAPVNGMGGLGIHLKEVLNRIDVNKYNVSAVCQGSCDLTFQNNKVKVFGLQETSYSLDSDAYIYTFILQSRFVACVNKLIMDKKMLIPDIIHIMDWTTAIAGYELAKQFNSKIIFAVHLSINNYIKDINAYQEASHRYATDIEFHICKSAHKILHVTKCYSELFPFNAFFYKTNIVYNGVDYSSFENANTKYNFPGNNSIKIVYLGRIAEMKNVHNILEVTEYFNNIDFIFVGGEEGSDLYLLEKLKKLARGNNTNVYYLGPKFGQEKLDILSSSDLILMPSNHEPFGLVALEALSAGQNGKTILCSSFVDGMGEFLTEDSAIKCGTSSNEITEGIYKFLNMKEIDKKNMRNNGCKLAQKYTWDDCVKQIENTYDSI